MPETRNQDILCSNCGNIIATVPPDYEITEEIVCGNCNEVVRPSTLIDDVAKKTKDIIDHTVDKFSK